MRARGGRETAADVDKPRRAVKRYGDEVKRADKKQRKTSAGVLLFRRQMTRLALILGVVLLAGVQAFAALGGGAFALASAMGPLVGLAAGFAGGMTAGAQALGVFGIAMLGVKAASKGMFKDFSKQTPAITALLRTVDGLTPALLHLKNQVQGRVLGGLTDGIRTLTPIIAVLSPAIVATASVIGRLERQGAKMLATMGPQMGRIMGTNVGLIDDLGHSAINLIHAFILILDAARPLTSWLGKLAHGWSLSILRATESGVATGKLNAFFDKTIVVTKKVLHIGWNLVRMLFGLGQAATPLGGGLLDSLDRLTTRMADFTNSAKGSAAITTFFNKLRPSLDALGNLVIALSTAMLPFVGSDGPLMLLARALTKVAQGISWIENNVPGATAVMSTLMTAMSVLAVAGFMRFTSSLWGFRAGLTVVRSALALLGIEMWIVRAAAFACWTAITGPVGLVVMAVLAVIAIFVLLYNKVSWFHNAVNAVWSFIKNNWQLLGAILLAPFAPLIAVLGTVIAHFKTIMGFAGKVVGIGKKISGGAVGAAKSIIPGLASGGTVGQAGSKVVGEKGPELVNLPRGAHVTPAGPTRAALAAGAGPTTVLIEVPVSLDGRLIGKAVARHVVLARSAR
jgi:hypothetical protein